MAKKSSAVAINLFACAQPLVLEENQIDFRTQKNTSNLQLSMKQRKARLLRIAAGVCAKPGCGEPVKGRINCRNCTIKNQIATERSIFKKYNVPLPKELR